jgi:hypothetical protein
LQLAIAHGRAELWVLGDDATAASNSSGEGTGWAVPWAWPGAAAGRLQRLDGEQPPVGAAEQFAGRRMPPDVALNPVDGPLLGPNGSTLTVSSSAIGPPPQRPAARRPGRTDQSMVLHPICGRRHTDKPLRQHRRRSCWSSQLVRV